MAWCTVHINRKRHAITKRLIADVNLVCFSGVVVAAGEMTTDSRPPTGSYILGQLQRRAATERKNARQTDTTWR